MPKDVFEELTNAHSDISKAALDYLKTQDSSGWNDFIAILLDRILNRTKNDPTNLAEYWRRSNMYMRLQPDILTLLSSENKLRLNDVGVALEAVLKPNFEERKDDKFHTSGTVYWSTPAQLNQHMLDLLNAMLGLVSDFEQITDEKATEFKERSESFLARHKYYTEHKIGFELNKENMIKVIKWIVAHNYPAISKRCFEAFKKSQLLHVFLNYVKLNKDHLRYYNCIFKTDLV